MIQLPPFHPNRPGLVAPVGRDPTGRTGPTRVQTRRRSWRRSSWGLYVPTEVSDDDPAQRIVEAGARLPSYGGVTGWAAVHWWGGAWSDGLEPDGATRRPVCLATGGTTISRDQGVYVSEEGLDPLEVSLHDGLRVTTALRAVAFEMRYAPSERQAAAVLAMAAYSDLVSVDEMALYLSSLSGWTGIPRARRATPLASENSWSPQEVLMQLVWELDAERPRPLCNLPVFNRQGRVIATPDLLDPEAGVYGEYDGSLHLAGSQRARDIQREGRLRDVGLEGVTMVAADKPDPTDFIRRLNGAYARARYAPESTRPWTIVPPPWWIPTDTVAARRALTAPQRARLLAHRRVA